LILLFKTKPTSLRASAFLLSHAPSDAKITDYFAHSVGRQTEKGMEKKPVNEFIPEFKNEFLLPRYWGAWLGVAAISAMALTPPSIRDPLLAKLALGGALVKALAVAHASICFTASLNILKKNVKPSSMACLKPRRRRW